LSTSDIHTLTASFASDTRKDILTGYFAALAALESRATSPDVLRAHRSALLNAAKSGKAAIYGLFGGQGANEVYFSELKSLYETYKPGDVHPKKLHN
jgi:fatty acid synthase subunit alpha